MVVVHCSLNIYDYIHCKLNGCCFKALWELISLVVQMYCNLDGCCTIALGIPRKIFMSIALWIPFIPLFFKWFAIIIWMLRVSVTSERDHGLVNYDCDYSYNDSMIYNFHFFVLQLTVCVAYFFEWITNCKFFLKNHQVRYSNLHSIFRNIFHCINKVLKIIIKKWSLLWHTSVIV